MRLLVLGGTGFAGRVLVDEALARGAAVTVFNRGTHDAPSGVTMLRGDRRTPGGLAALATGEWDCVVDTWTDAPIAVRDAARLLVGRVGHYTYVSSRSVYTYPPKRGLTEEGPLVEGSPDAGEDGSEVEYAPAKRGGELAVQAVFGDGALLARAGLIIGPYENTGRLPWWLGRVARGGLVAAPGPRDLGLQYIDPRDLAIWILDAAGRGLGGAYNVFSPPDHTTMGELLETCVTVTDASAQLSWITPEAILAAGVEPWIELPLWLPPGELHDGMHRGDVSKAVAAGLRCRPIAQTVADTWKWMGTLAGEPPLRPDRPVVGLSQEAEQKLLSM
jgi:nucleoside-diphosphate-sugar epimerase